MRGPVTKSAQPPHRASVQARTLTGAAEGALNATEAATKAREIMLSEQPGDAEC